MEGSLHFSEILIKWLQVFTQQEREFDMKTSIVFAVLLWAILPGISGAAIYQYVDDDGQVHYTNDLTTVPADKLDQVTESEETESDSTPPAPSYSGPKYPLLQQDPAAEALKLERARLEKKERLQAEYEALLKEKEALDNDESFQKRRTKRKYQNRPYIQELIAREAEIKQRLLDIEQQLKAL
jgi:hypothetical protein